MKYKWKRVLAVVFLFIIVAGWYVTVCGIGPVKPIQDRMKLGLDIKGGVYVVMEAKTDLKGEELQKAMEQTQAVIEERVNQMGLAEPVVTIEGDKRIRVELPGAEDAQEAIEQIGKTAQLQFALADGTIAGSATCLYDCMKRAVLEMNVPLESAVRAASENPARSIGVDNDYGSLAAGRYGNVILADKELNIKAVIQKGTRIV